MTISLATRFKKVKLFFHFTFFEWAFININVKEIISTLFDFLKDNFPIISSLLPILMIIF